MAEESKLVDKLDEKQSEVKFTEEEMQGFADIRSEYLDVQNRLGQVSMNKLRFQQQMDNLLEVESKLVESFSSIQSKEKKFIDGINEKYGDGELNPETGVFTPTKS